ncbi:MAG: 50S ribosomal protein L18 [Chloracidobacterium sp.]|nr:50S ribosomal protein L18 [Chloracidobacterium validum]
MRKGKKNIILPTRFRLCVHRSSKHIRAQIIDDKIGVTICSASSLGKNVQNLELVSEANLSTKIRFANHVGTEIARKAKEKGIFEVFFDRNGYKYHGRIRQLAEAARKEGLSF